MNEAEQLSDRELDALVAGRVMEHRVSDWSLHLVNSAAEVEGREFMHGMWSQDAFAKGEFPTKVFFPNADGDTPYQAVWIEQYSDLLDEKFWGWSPVPHYSTEIACAFQVAEKMRERGYAVQLGDIDDVHSSKWRARMSNTSGRGSSVYDESLPRAICLAALKSSE